MPNVVTKVPTILLFCVVVERPGREPLRPEGVTDLDQAERMVDICAKKGFTAYIRTTTLLPHVEVVA